MYGLRVFLLLLCGHGLAVAKEFVVDSFARDLSCLTQIQERTHRKFPVTYNFFFQGGTFMMPNALMAESGEVGIGVSSVSPYLNTNVRVQLFPLLECSGSYRVFRGVEDPVLSPYGFGDFADKGVNVKLALFRPEWNRYTLPTFAIGFDDILGTRQFKAQYLVATHVFERLGLVASLGYGRQRIRGFFGSLEYFPWDFCSVGIEYDAIDYQNPAREPHPRGRKQSSPWNVGVKCHLPYLDVSMAYVRGEKVACAGHVSYNLGNTRGLVQKYQDLCPYTYPKNFEPVGHLRTQQLLAQEVSTALAAHGFELSKAYLYYDTCRHLCLELQMHSLKYRDMTRVHQELLAVVQHLCPDNVWQVTCQLLVKNLRVQQIVFSQEMLDRVRAESVTAYEKVLLTPLTPIIPNPSPCPQLIYEKRPYAFRASALPQFHSLFGSSKGKFKYATGVCVDFDGCFWDTFYQVQLSYLFFSHLDDSSSIDRLNPSQLPQVHTDLLRYEKQRGVIFEKAFIQKHFSLAPCHYGRVSCGWFNRMYGGVGLEYLYDPLCAPFAMSLNASILAKRTLKGLGFTNKVRRLHGFVLHTQTFLGVQAFVDFYTRIQSFDVQLSLGRFLAGDVGVRCQVARRFPSGLELGLWHTWTNGNDRVNGSTYYDKGVFFSMPLDIFFPCSSLQRFGYGMSAWLRDVGYRTSDGISLYSMIRNVYSR